ncbi:MAG: M28 family peptidase [Bacteroidales bacterium]|jgi:hypothetical protein|nr:M28 family peptidase [Bacteroidales bacterium]
MKQIFGMSILLFFVTITIIFTSCKKEKISQIESIDYSKVEIPSFNADSAYYYVAKQCDFGSRTPNSQAHNLCLEYLVDFMKQQADTVYVQKFDSKLYNGTKVTGKNIIASFNLEATDRVLLAAHWDSRLWADNDKDASLHKTPVPGANDGASGVGVLMEIARILKSKPLKQGIDIIFFDLEDQGIPEWETKEENNQQTDWCIGSQYWSQNKHIPFYTANYGILLDMVGYKAARFTKEYQSMGYAASIMNKIWDIAKAKGYEKIFVDVQTSGIMDDHIWVNHHAKIPMIDIVQNDPEGNFFPHWHTTTDDMDAISKETLKIVGEVCLTAIYSAQ